MINKYIKPKSLTWLVSFSTLAAGLVIATEPLHGMTAIVDVIRTATGMTSPQLIMAGLGGIGMRGALGK